MRLKKNEIGRNYMTCILFFIPQFEILKLNGKRKNNHDFSFSDFFSPELIYLFKLLSRIFSSLFVFNAQEKVL